MHDIIVILLIVLSFAGIVGLAVLSVFRQIKKEELNYTVEMAEAKAWLYQEELKPLTKLLVVVKDRGIIMMDVMPKISDGYKSIYRIESKANAGRIAYAIVNGGPFHYGKESFPHHQIMSVKVVKPSNG